MDTSEQYIKMCEKAEEIQAIRVDKEYPTFVHRSHKLGDYFIYKDPTCVEIRMTGDDSPGEPVTRIYVFGSEEVHGADIPKKEQYISFVGSYKTFKDPLNELIWLPRQDQLQAMFGNSLITLLDKFEYWRKNTDPIHKDVISQMLLSMEQLWLAFVMNEKCGKVWKGEDWVKEK